MNTTQRIISEHNEEASAPPPVAPEKAPQKDGSSPAVLQKKTAVARTQESLRRILLALAVIQKHIERSPTDHELRNLHRTFDTLKARADDILHRLGKKAAAHDDHHGDEHHEHHEDDGHHDDVHVDHPVHDHGLHGDTQHFGAAIHHLEAEVMVTLKKTAHHLSSEGDLGSYR